MQLLFEFFILPLMNKKIVLIAIVILLLGGGYYFFALSHSNPLQTAMKQNQTAHMSTQKKSLFDFLSMTGSLKCTFSEKDESNSGTVYVGAGKMRGDFKSQNEGKTEQMHMANDSKFVYIWTDGQKTGYKMSLDTVKNSMMQIKNDNSGANASSGEQTPSGTVNFKKQSNYSCSPAAVNTSLFTTPQDITFTDFSTMMQGANGEGSPLPITSKQGSQAACAQCNQVPAGAMRNQCLSALKCQ